MPAQPTPIDLGIRVAFTVAHRMLRAYWRVRHPHTKGALVAAWYAGKILIVKNSYRREHTLPGGYRRPGETAGEAAARELAEECGIFVEPRLVREVYRAIHPFEHRQDDVAIVEVELNERPPVIPIDHREVVWADFTAPQEVLKLPIVPHLREYLEERAARTP